jgi:hypothetical protein
VAGRPPNKGNTSDPQNRWPLIFGKDTMINLLCILLGAAFLQPGVCNGIPQAPAFAGANPLRPDRSITLPAQPAIADRRRR